jgi:hypothetical protein
MALRLAARRSAVQAATDPQRQLHALVVAAPDTLRGRLRGLTTPCLVSTCARLRQRTDPDPETSTWGPRGHGGVQHADGAGFLAMGFEYRTQPRGDPLLHPHLVIANRVRRSRPSSTDWTRRVGSGHHGWPSGPSRPPASQAIRSP